MKRMMHLTVAHRSGGTGRPSSLGMCQRLPSVRCCNVLRRTRGAPAAQSPGSKQDFQSSEKSFFKRSSGDKQHLAYGRQLERLQT